MGMNGGYLTPRADVIKRSGAKYAQSTLILASLMVFAHLVSSVL